MRHSLRILFAISLLSTAFVASNVGSAAPICVNQGPIHTCVDDPTVVDAGTMTAANGAATAAAQGGLALGLAQAAEFTATYSFGQANVAPGSSYSFTATLAVVGPNGATLGYAYAGVSYANANATPTSFSQSGTLVADVAGSSELIAGGGSVVLQSLEYYTISTPSRYESGPLASARSTAAITLLAAPDMNTVATTDVQPTGSFQAGTITLSPTAASASLTSGATIVATGTEVVFHLGGTIARTQQSGMTYTNEGGNVNFYVTIDGVGSYYASQFVGGVYCYDSAAAPTCSLPGGNVPVSLDIVVPASALHARSPLTVSADASYSGSGYGPTSSFGFGQYTGGSGRDVMYGL